MTTSYSISSPSPYVTPTAVGFTDPDGNLIVASDSTPLPVTTERGTAPVPLAGDTSLSMVAGPFIPLRDAPVHLELAGEWSGVVSLERSADGGTTRSGVTAGGMPWASFSGNVNEVVWQEAEAGASLFLDIAVTSGTVSYRVSQ